MELQRGVCNLCLENNKVLHPSDCEKLTNLLPQLFIQDEEIDALFQKFRHQIKLCSCCSYKLQLVKNMTPLLDTKNEGSNEKDCKFCRNQENLVRIPKNDWKYFNDRVKGLMNNSDFPVVACCRCIFYLDTLYNFRVNLGRKIPQLNSIIDTKLSSKGSVETPKRKSLLKSSPRSKKRKIFNSCFTYLQPLASNEYNVDPSLRTDLKLYKDIAYVNLIRFEKELTPKVRPKIKIKLKPSKRKPKESHDLQKKLFDRLSKSEEKANNGRQQYSVRRASLHENNAKLDETLDETPKAPLESLNTKRRVSIFEEIVKSVEEEEEKEDSSEKEESSGKEDTLEKEESSAKAETSKTTEDINQIVNKYINDTSFNDGTKLDLLEELDKADTSDVAIPDIAINGSEELLSKEENDNLVGNVMDEDVGEKLLSDKDPLLSETTDSLTYEDDQENKESINGSEKKKKRVTFSDEIN